jgi:alpha-L-rhamnosidase
MKNWIWYPGDFEIYHIMKQNFIREERGFRWPAYWYTANWNHNVTFKKNYHLLEPTSFLVHAVGIGYVLVKKFKEGVTTEQKYVFDEKITCLAGDYEIKVMVANLEALPAVFVDGDVVYSNDKWISSNHLDEVDYSGSSPIFQNITDNPLIFPKLHHQVLPKQIVEKGNGVLYDFGHDITAAVTIKPNNNGIHSLDMCYGESLSEAFDTKDCYLKDHLNFQKSESVTTEIRAFRFIFIPQIQDKNQLNLIVDFQKVELPNKSSFLSSDKEMTAIWQTASLTFELCSGIFFVDGVKRDQWVWSGDAYQSYFINRYSLFDQEIAKRTILGLRGPLEIKQHLNTIVDYSLYWLLSVEDYYQQFGDVAFIKQVYPKVISLLHYCLEQTNTQGFILGRKQDWIYIDWADFDKEGAFCPEQMLLVKALDSVANLQAILQIDNSTLLQKKQALVHNIQAYFWDEQKGAFIDSYESGKRHVTRHGNIFSILYGIATADQINLITKNVLFNSDVSAITTPYFKFWELQVFAKLGYADTVIAEIKKYWGGMLANGATTFWEYFDPKEKDDERFAMYGDKYGKSLCHAWGATPIYLLGRFLAGVKATSPGYKTFQVAPNLTSLDSYTITLPLGTKDQTITIKKTHHSIALCANVVGGTVSLHEKNYQLYPNKPLEITLIESEIK